MTWFAVGAAVVGTVGSAVSSSSAARGQQRAADAATEEQRRQFDMTQANQQPYREAGTNALANLVQLSGQYGKAPTAEQVMAQPGYQFGLTQGQNAVNNQGAATGGLYSGQQLRAASRFNTDYATTKYDDAFNRNRLQEGDTWNRYSALAGIGQTATNQLQGAGQNYANQVGQIGMSNANAQGAATIAQGNALQNGLNQAGSALRGWQWPTTPSYTTPNANGSYNNPYGGDFMGVGQAEGRPRGGMAEGGPVVRAEPVIGTRAPVRSGGGGGLSTNALLQLLAQQQMLQQQQQPQQPYGVGALPFNPVTQPGAILDARMRQTGYMGGGPVHGPGGPKDDQIPAMLSDGEHVVDAASVNAIGGGNNGQGQQRLNKLRMMVKGGR